PRTVRTIADSCQFSTPLRHLTPSGLMSCATLATCQRLHSRFLSAQPILHTGTTRTTFTLTRRHMVSEADSPTLTHPTRTTKLAHGRFLTRETSNILASVSCLLTVVGFSVLPLRIKVRHSKRSIPSTPTCTFAIAGGCVAP